MKKLTLTLLFSLITATSFAQQVVSPNPNAIQNTQKMPVLPKLMLNSTTYLHGCGLVIGDLYRSTSDLMGFTFSHKTKTHIIFEFTQKKQFTIEILPQHANYLKEYIPSYLATCGRPVN